MPVLLVERGNDKGLSLKVEPAKTYIVGRENEKAAFQLNDPMASRAHFQISAQNGTYRIRDMKSRNGTKLNDEKLPAEGDAEVKIGDKIQVGETIFSFLSDAKEESAAGGLIGKTIGGYKLLERVGRGGMGTVYKAEQMSLNRVVALKVLSAKLLSDPVFVEKFVAEAKAAGGLTHPNIVQVIDVGSDRGIYFFSMEYLDNGSVGDVATKEGKVPWERALAMMTDAAKGLIFAEKRGIVHRDIKPDNLMLTSEGTVKIGDLGLAKKSEDIGGEGGQIFGTPHFIAPEQAQGKPVDNRADLYALGATFYRVLGGKTPFTGDNVKEILLQQIQKEPEPLEKLAPDMPEELGKVVAKLMKKKADDRYRSAQGLYEDLERIRVQYHVEAKGVAQSAQRSKAIAWVLGLAVCGLGYALYMVATKVILPPPPPPPVVVPTNTGPKPLTPEEQKALLEKDAEIAFSPILNRKAELMVRLKGDVAETWRGNESAWTDLAAEFQKLADKWPDTKKGVEAATEAKTIRTDLEKARTAWETKGVAANQAWTKVLADMKDLAAQGKFNEALALQAEADRMLQNRENRAFLPPQAQKDLAAAVAGVLDAAEAKVKPLLEKADAEAQKFPGAGYMDARDALEAVKGGVVPAAEARDPSTATLAALAKKIDDVLASSRKAAEDAAADALDDDRDAWVNAYLAIRRWLPDDAPADAAETPFFAYRWDDALARWEALRKVLKTKPFRDKVDLKIEIYRRCKRLFETLAAKVRTKDLADRIQDPAFPEYITNRATVTLDNLKRDKATPVGIQILIIRGPSRSSEFLEFRAFMPRDIYEYFLRKGDNQPLSGEDHLDLACFLMEAGCGDVASSEEKWAMAGTRPVKVDPALEAWFRWEVSAYLAWNAPGGVVPLYNSYKRDKAAGARKEALEEARKAIEARVREILAKESYWISDFSILNLSQGGPEGPKPEKVLPDAVTDDFLLTLGVEGGRRLPPAPPPPANGNGGIQQPPPPPGGEHPGKGENAPPPPAPAPGPSDPDKPR